MAANLMTLFELFRLFFRYWYLLFIGIAITVAMAYWYLDKTPRHYEATVLLDIGKIRRKGGGGLDSRA